MRNRDRWFLLTALVLLDTGCIAMSMTLAYYLRIESSLLPFHSPPQLGGYVRAAATVLPVWILLFASCRLYSTRAIGDGTGEYGRIVKACTFGVIASITLSFWGRDVLISRGYVVITWVLSVTAVSLARNLVRHTIQYLRGRGMFVSRLIVIGTNEHARAVARQLGDSRKSGFETVGFLDDYLPVGTTVVDDFRVLGLPTELGRIASSTGADQVIVVPDALAWDSYHELVRQIACGSLKPEICLSPGLYEILTMGMTLSHRAGVPMLTLEGIRLRGSEAFLKNLTDYALACVLLIPAFPAMAIIALAIRLVDRQPVFARHMVMGFRGLPFATLKFHTGLDGLNRRSLVSGGKRLNPARQFRVGRFLYCTGLDKLPQILNVLSGKMSMVGPRTVPVAHHRLYQDWLPSLSTVKPGITGPWLVSEPLPLEAEARLTLNYIRQWSIWLDLQILLETVLLVLRTGRRTLSRPKNLFAFGAATLTSFNPEDCRE